MVAPDNATETDIKKSVMEYAEKKLYILPFQYFHTNSGKEWAELLHDVTIKSVNRFVCPE